MPLSLEALGCEDLFSITSVSIFEVSPSPLLPELGEGEFFDLSASFEKTYLLLLEARSIHGELLNFLPYIV